MMFVNMSYLGYVKMVSTQVHIKNE
jgi:hypothetical protein